MQRLLGLLTAVVAVAQVTASTAASAPPEQIHIAFAGAVIAQGVVVVVAIIGTDGY
jgi:hypothetical protein